ncbi:HlyD family type I secretion periplasmic adaptor subunit [Vibrio agarivorans]|uniref:Membrane fusion protein (MFP) family protein n=1 Tax=Vibrio agarivorans TaxID=153622 RepID=A0ABT7Y0N5_9VIBR|nr:HlyD family type I secretion periplasmic adaptor subunit [Vibrio agarivorans]MDN2481575.1 HlyD family type I secretion periplasmic adaptor subunit [Vibrio agarivorans]
MSSSKFKDQGVTFEDGRRLDFSGKHILAKALFVIVVMLGGFIFWSFTSPLHSAAIAPGVIIVESKKKPIQHLEGGIIDHIHVQDGDNVEAGDLLITLSPTQAQANLNRLRAQWESDLARLNRLQAEIAGHSEIRFDPRLLSRAGSPEIQSILRTQQALFDKGQSLKDGEIDILEEKIEQARLDMVGLQQRYQAGRASLSYLAEQLSMHKKLLSSGNTSKSRYLDLQREYSQLQGQIADLNAQIGRAKGLVAEAKMELTNADYNRAKDLGEEVQQLERALNETREAMVNAQDVLQRVEIRAPQSGVIVSLNVVGSNAIIAPGDTLMEIVPQEDELIVEALVRPEDIEVMYVGLKTQVRLTAFSFRKTPPIDGKLIHISADRINDPQSGTSAYLAKVSLDQELLKQLDGSISLYPGMPAEVMILLEEQTPFDYLINPLAVASYRAMREM